MIKSFSLLSCFILFLSLTAASLSSCRKELYAEFTPDFSYEYREDNPNIVRYVNATSGEHKYIQWDFGNGEQTDKQPASKLSYSAFYPLKGQYTVELTVWGISGREDDRKSVTKTVSIENSEPVPGFEYSIIEDSANYVRLTDISTGDYESIIWRYPGREYHGVPGEEKVIYLAMGASYDIELEIRRNNIIRSVSREIVIADDDPDYLDHYRPVWSDEFDGDTIDNSQWVHETGDHGWGNQELQDYTDGLNTSVSGGLLKITARKTGSGQNAGDYTSSRLNSTESFTYGRFEVRAKMPENKGPGLWPAIWMLGRSIQEGTSWPLCGEMDIMEYVSWKPDHFSCAIHTESNNHVEGNAVTSGHISLPGVDEEFHTYGLIWTYTGLKFYLDSPDNIIMSYRRPVSYDSDNWPFDQPFYFLLNIAVGGLYGGVEGVDDTVFPAVMEIDYVRVYQLE